MKIAKTASPFNARPLVLVGSVALAAAILLALRNPGAFGPAWRFAVFACFGPALGSLVFVQIHLMTGGAWGRDLATGLAAGLRLAPWFWLLLAPLVAGSGFAQGWGGLGRYVSPASLALRAAVYGLVFFGLVAAARRAWRRPGNPARPAWAGPAGLIIVTFMGHLLATDWLESGDPRWNSTAFPLVWLTGQAVAGLALALLGGCAAGFDPARPLARGRSSGGDAGTLLFAAAMTWCYVEFAQFLIVWSGNLPAETGWFARRLAGGWAIVPAALLLLQFVVPLVLLTSRRAKETRRGLVVACVALLAAHVLNLAWIILPGSVDAGGLGLGIALLAGLGLGAGFLAAYRALIVRETGVANA